MSDEFLETDETMFDFRCDRYPGSVGFPSQRRNETANFVGGKSSIWKECPEKCRRKDHLEWKFC